MKRVALICLLVFSILLCAGRAMSKESRIHFGKLQVVPGVQFKIEYDDNIYLGSGDKDLPFEDEESDWVFHFMPLVTLEYPITGRGSIIAGYKGDFAYYNDNDENDWKRHEGFIRFDYVAPGGLILGLDNQYVDTEDPYSASNQYLLGAPQVKRWYNDLNTKVGFRFSDRFKFFGYYNFFKQEYDDVIDFTQNYDESEFGGGFETLVLPKTWGFLRYHYGERDYFDHPTASGVNSNNDSDFDYHRVNAGLLWLAAAKIKGELDLGYVWKEYKNSFDVNGDPYEDRDTWIANTFVAFKANDITTISVSLARGLREESAVTNIYFEDTGAGVNVAMVLRRKWTLNMGLLYSKNDYKPSSRTDREDDNVKAKLDLDYKIRRWLSAGVGYQYWEKDSNIRIYDFKDNRVWLKVSLIYQ